MQIDEVIREYFKNYYVVIYDPHKLAIILCDEFDGPAKNSFSNGEIINIGSIDRNTVVLFWDKINDVTGVEYYHKENKEKIQSMFKDAIGNEKTKSFFKLLVKENIPVCLNISEIIEEFPTLI